MLSRFSSILVMGVLLAGMLPAGQQVLAATAAEEIEALIGQGQLHEALSATNQQLAAEPANVNYQFLKGLILTRQNQLDAAKEVFIKLTKDHPELPEPFNNLAVIYAEQGDFNNAREALQMAINTHPSYATAHENLGDIYAKMASRAYNQALELDQDNASAREKLLLVSDLISTPGPGPAAAATATGADTERLAGALKEQQQALRNAESQAQAELNKVNQLRQELATLQAQRAQAEQDARAAAAQAQTANTELAKVRQQNSQAGQQAQQAQQQAETQAAKLKTDIAAMTAELQQLTANRDQALQQAAAARQQAEEQTRSAQATAQQARAETAALEQRAKDLRLAMDRQAAAAEEQLNQSRQRIQQLQAEVSRLEQQQAALAGQVAEDRRQAQARTQQQQAELDQINAEVARMQQARAALAAQSRVAQPAAPAAVAPTRPEDTGSSRDRDLMAAVKLWAERWTAQDVDGYLAAYASDFRPPDGSSRSAWATQRRERIRKARFIRVQLSDIQVKVLNDQHARIMFTQSYQSEAYKDEVSKTLLLRRQDGRWLIVEESTTG